MVRVLLCNAFCVASASLDMAQLLIGWVAIGGVVSYDHYFLNLDSF